MLICIAWMSVPASAVTRQAPGTPIEQSVSNWISASWEDAAEALGAYYVLYTYMVPISLFVTIEISRLAQALFMFWDDEMMSPQGERMKPSNSNLNEDLGRVRGRPAVRCGQGQTTC